MCSGALICRAKGLEGLINGLQENREGSCRETVYAELSGGQIWSLISNVLNIINGLTNIRKDRAPYRETVRVYEGLDVTSHVGQTKGN